MTPRSIRRAEERKAAKLARKAAHALGSLELEAAEPEVEPDTFDAAPKFAETAELFEAPEAFSDRAAFAEPETSAPPVSDAQLAANRRNAQLSTGPTSSAGKAKISHNAVKTALTGRTVVLPSEDAAAYQEYIQKYAAELAPVGQMETDLVQSIADSGWRLQRIPALELAIYAKGRIELAESCNEYLEEMRPAMLEVKAGLAYEKQLRNLHLQEARLYRRREKDLAELRSLQQERKASEAKLRKQALERVAGRYLAAKAQRVPFEPRENGFEFSNEEILRFLATMPDCWRDLHTARAAKQAA